MANYKNTPEEEQRSGEIFAVSHAWGDPFYYNIETYG